MMYAPQHRPGLKIDLLMEEKLVLVTTDPEARLLDGTDYVYMDWGPDFALHHEMNFPDAAPDLSIDLGPLALSYVLAAGGSGYFRMSAVQPYLAAGRLHLVPEMPQFSYPVYAVQSANADETVAGPALAGLHSVSSGNWRIGSNFAYPASLDRDGFASTGASTTHLSIRIGSAREQQRDCRSNPLFTRDADVTTNHLCERVHLRQSYPGAVLALCREERIEHSSQDFVGMPWPSSMTRTRT